MEAHAVDVARDDEGEELLPGPQRLGAEDGGHGQLAVPGGQEHDEVHHLLLVQENVALGHLANSGQGVLGAEKKVSMCSISY